MPIALDRLYQHRAFFLQVLLKVLEPLLDHFTSAKHQFSPQVVQVKPGVRGIYVSASLHRFVVRKLHL
jgi:hypothetical protein